MTEAFYEIVSDKTLLLHKGYLEKQKLKYSVCEKSYPCIKGKGIGEINKMRSIARGDKENITSLSCDIILHETYFQSFGREYQSSEVVRKLYRTETSFLYTVYEASMQSDGGFVVIRAERDKIIIDCVSQPSKLLNKPILAVDICEHAYFYDFGFEKEKYLERVLPRLNLNMLDNFFQSRLKKENICGII